MRWITMGLGAAALILLAGAGARAQETPPAYRVIGYYSSWSIYSTAYLVTDIPAAQLTHINYAFINISEDGECVLGDPWADTEFPYPGDDTNGDRLHGNFRQLQLLKEAHPHLQTLISVGGWTWSGRFSDVALTADSRAKFARSCVAMMLDYGFDGIDVDWEYPGGGGLEGNTARPEDRDNFTLLLAELRAQLDAQGEQDGRAYLLTIAVPAGNQYRQMDLAAIHPLLDWMNLMAYDFNGGWSDRTGFNAPLYTEVGQPSADASVQAYLEAGVPPDKLVLGVPFYGRGWTGVPATNDGLGQPFTGLPGEQGALNYRTLVDTFPNGTRYWSEESQVPWLYDAETQTMFSYDDAESLASKAAYVREHGLGGMMIWELRADDADSTLLTAIDEALHAE
jgi:chitinase